MPNNVICDNCPAPVSISWRNSLNNYSCDNCGTLYYPPNEYEKAILSVLDIIEDMRKSGSYDENTLETLEWKLADTRGEE